SGEMLYAVGQGAIGVETRANDENMRKILSKIEDKPATLACIAERSLLRTLEGGCSAPLGVETKWVQSDVLQMKGIVVSVDGSESVESDMQARLQTVTGADHFGE